MILRSGIAKAGANLSSQHAAEGFMKGLLPRIQKLPLTLLVAGLMSMPVLADDTEIYVGRIDALTAGNVIAQPNVLFVIDTSGSMSTTVQTQGAYDAGVSYNGCFDVNKVYFSSSGIPTNCDSTQTLPTTVLRCDAAASLSTTGVYQDGFLTFAQLNIWWPGLSFIDSATHIECLSDRGLHGATTASPLVYPRSGSSLAEPYTSDVNVSVARNNYVEYTLYTGNFLNYTQDVGVVEKTRLQVVQDVLVTLLDSMSGVNVGLMRFDTGAHGGPVTFAVQDLASNRAAIKAEAQSYFPQNATPLSEALYEAARYYKGMSMDFGRSSEPSVDPNAKSDASTYKSPVIAECQSNYIVLLSDGEPVSDDEANTRVPNLPGFQQATGKTACADEHGTGSNGRCLDEIALYLKQGDLTGAFENNQFVTTYTVGFALDHALLRATADAGGGAYYIAEDYLSLLTSFTNIFNEIKSGSGTFTSPAVSVNAFNRATHRDELYFTVFSPAQTPHWNGNVKKYRLGVLSGESAILDANGNRAVDPDTGFFSANALSYWTQTPLPDGSAADGNKVNLGGTASKLPPLNRRIYTYTGAAAPSNVLLTAAEHQLHESNTAITSQMLGIADGATNPSRAELLQWARGVDVDGIFPGDGRPVMGDPLHSRPIVVQYGGTEASPDLTLFVTTNDGYLHAFNESDGTERFAFVPQVMLDDLDDLKANPISGTRPYGLDGSVVAWVNDENRDGVIAGNDHVHLYVGMRRGGQNYYALDVTNRDAPRLLWRIDGGTAGFEELGQSWSDPVVTRMKVDGVERTVLVIGGGYDVAQDSKTLRSPDSVGRAVYVVDAETGQRLWWAGPAASGASLQLAEMTNSIPSRVAVIDIDGDGLADIMYVGDTGGQIWRFDVDNDVPTGLTITGGRIAELSAADTEANNRRFYHPPDVSYQLDSGIPSYLAIAIGSGYQAHPLNTAVRDRIYVLRDTDVFNPPESYVTRTEADLFDATDNVLGEGTDAEQRTARVEFIASDGWFIRLEEPDGSAIGEKVLSEPQIVANTLAMTTFAPVENINPCSGDEGRGAVYFLNIADGTPTQDFDAIEGRQRADRKIFLKRGGIPPTPTLVITENNAVNLVGPEIVGNPLPNRNFKTYWQRR